MLALRVVFLVGRAGHAVQVDRQRIEGLHEELVGVARSDVRPFLDTDHLFAGEVNQNLNAGNFSVLG